MGSFNNSFTFQPFQVATHGRFRGIQQTIQIIHSDDFMGYQILLDSLSPLCWNERFSHFVMTLG